MTYNNKCNDFFAFIIFSILNARAPQNILGAIAEFKKCAGGK